MEKMNEIRQLLEKGVSPRELVKQGYPRATVYTVAKKTRDTVARRESDVYALRLARFNRVLIEILADSFLSFAGVVRDDETMGGRKPK